MDKSYRPKVSGIKISVQISATGRVLQIIEVSEIAHYLDNARNLYMTYH